MKETPALDHLSTTDSSGKRIKVFPAEVKTGFWAVRKQGFHLFLILFYLILPWIKIKGHPLLQLDIIHRRFSIFGKLFFAHEVPNLVFITLSFLLFIGLVTTLFGRAWCGWSCPQTVFVERIFRKIEYWIEGDFIEQKKLQAREYDLDKIFKKTAKWALFTLFTVILSHSFLAYFVGSEASYHLMTSPPTHNMGDFIFVLIFSAIVLFDFGWFREQFCLIACPYGKMQSVMMDSGSYFLAYDEKRGDCINCNKCVTVCPTGIDVRNGLQIECIACTACADACDSIMTKIKKPTNLIGYGNQFSLQNKKTPFLRGRVIVYSTLLLVSLTALGFRLSNRMEHQTEITRAIDIPYQVITNADGSKQVLNHFKIRFYNLDWHPASADFSLSNQEIQGLEMIRSGESGNNQVESGNFIDRQFFIKVPLSYFNEAKNTKILISTVWNQSEIVKSEINLVGPQLGI